MPGVSSGLIGQALAEAGPWGRPIAYSADEVGPELGRNRLRPANERHEMQELELDFASYVRQRKGAEANRSHGGAAYAYPGDQKVLTTLAKVTPVRLAVEATVRLWKNFARSQILGSAVKVTDKQFPEIYQTTVDCARRLQIAVPTVYIAPEVGALNAHTFGTSDDAFIVLNGVLVDHLSPEELRFVIGHECGHIENNHVVYTTALYYLMYSANLFLRWIVQPAIMALQSWSRRAEITCDRAGLICTKDAAPAHSALVKLALGSQKLAARIDLDEYLKQLEESQVGAGRLLELLQSHPYLPKRVAALRLFAQTHYYLQAIGVAKANENVGLSLDACDAGVARIISVFGKDTPAPAADPVAADAAPATSDQRREGSEAKPETTTGTTAETTTGTTPDGGSTSTEREQD